LGVLGRLAEPIVSRADDCGQIHTPGDHEEQAPRSITAHGHKAEPANVLDLVPRLARPNLTYLAPAHAKSQGAD